MLLVHKKRVPKQVDHFPSHSLFPLQTKRKDKDILITKGGKNSFYKARVWMRCLGRKGKLLPHMKSNTMKKGFKNLQSNSLQERENDELLTPAKDAGTCLGKINMFRKETSSPSFFYLV